MQGGRQEFCQTTWFVWLISHQVVGWRQMTNQASIFFRAIYQKTLFERCFKTWEPSQRFGMAWVVPPPRMPVTSRIITFLGSGIPNLNLHLPRLHPGRGGQPISNPRYGDPKIFDSSGVEPRFVQRDHEGHRTCYVHPGEAIFTILLTGHKR